MSVLTEIGRAAMAKAIKEQSMFLALGTGSPEWGEVPPREETNSTELIAEVGRRALSRCLFVTPDEESGTVEVPTSLTTDEDGAQTVEVKKYSVSETPTRHLLVEFNLDFGDAAGLTLRELGLFVGAKVKEGLPSGKMYFAPDDFDDPGLLYQLEYREPIIRNPFSHDSYTWVINI